MGRGKYGNGYLVLHVTVNNAKDTHDQDKYRSILFNHIKYHILGIVISAYAVPILIKPSVIYGNYDHKMSDPAWCENGPSILVT